jgi:hypothetical protein
MTCIGLHALRYRPAEAVNTCFEFAIFEVDWYSIEQAKERIQRINGPAQK